MNDTSTPEKLSDAGNRMVNLVGRLIVTTVVAMIFVGMWFLVYTGRMTAEPLILLSGVIIGYLARYGREQV